MNLIMLKNIGLVVGGIWIGAVLTHRSTDTQSPTLPTLTLQTPTPTPCEEQPQWLTDKVPPKPDIQMVADSTPTVNPRPQTARPSTTTHRKQRTVRRQRAARYDQFHETYEDYRLEQRMSRPPGTPWRNFSAPDEHGYPNN
jgi:hypothetical protein